MTVQPSPEPPAASGLTSGEAASRLASDGPNELPSGDRRTGFRILLGVVKEPMLALLLAGGAIYALLGEMRDAVVLMVFACLSVVITLVQEWRSEKVLEALRDLSSPRALVVRDGRMQRIAGRDVVRGDVVVLSEGDRIPADARLLSAQDLQADESLLTGEAAPVRKVYSTGPDVVSARPGGDDLPFVFSGTLVVRGKGMAEVIATGPRAEIGKIGKSLATVGTEAPRLYVQTRRIVLLLALVGALVSLLVGGLYAHAGAGWLDAILAGIAIGMSMMPEEFPVVLAIFMAMGAWRLSRARVLTRRAAAIETLGAATVLCTDKTGTLTQNRMAIRQVRLPDGRSFEGGTLRASGTGSAAEVLRAGLLACDPEPFDPMEQAFHAIGTLEAQHHEPGLGLVRTYGLRPDLLSMSQVWRSAGSEGLIVAAKGAPEAIASLCRLSGPARMAMSREVDAMAAAGLRVLGVAEGTMKGELPERQQDLPLTWLGLVGLADPLRDGVPQAVAECRRAGIDVKMITGDYPVTAVAIAREAGLEGLSPLTGTDLDALDDAALVALLKEGDVFARILPDQKLRIVNALKAQNAVVAMTGDGVNDAPSLKSAHIGIAMGGRGTDVAREASSLVLLDDDFTSIVGAIRLGRQIYDNLRKAAAFILAVHLPIAGLAIAPLLFGLPIVLYPIHIAFLEMVIDPVCTLVFEGEDEEDDIMDRPPRDPDERLFSAGLIGWSVLQGVVAFAAVAASLVWSDYRQMPEDGLRVLVFFTLVATIIALIFVNRSFSASPFLAVARLKPALVLVLAAVAGILVVVNFWDAARDIFSFAPLRPADLILTGSAGVAVLLVLEAVKPFWHLHRGVQGRVGSA